MTWSESRRFTLPRSIRCGGRLRPSGPFFRRDHEGKRWIVENHVKEPLCHRVVGHFPGAHFFRAGEDGFDFFDIPVLDMV